MKSVGLDVIDHLATVLRELGLDADVTYEDDPDVDPGPGNLVVRPTLTIRFPSVRLTRRDTPRQE